MSPTLRRVDLDPEARELAWANARSRRPEQIGTGWSSARESALLLQAADPASILDGEEELAEIMERHRRPAFGRSVWASQYSASIAASLTAFGRATVALGVAFEEAAVRLARLAEALAPTVARLTETLQEFAISPAVADQNRRRHGSAALCPRHGPTRGGLCRRCQR